MLLALPGTSSAKKVRWNIAGASIYGGACGDSGTQGYRGVYLPEHPWSYAELGMGTYLGNLPNKARIRVLDPDTHRKTWITKNDIGGGGGSVEGHTRRIDLYEPVASWLSNASCTWTGVILWRK